MRRVGALALLLSAAAGAAGAGAPPAVRLLAPVEGTALEAGTTSRLEWEPVGEFDPAIEEWEAFLSVDGGGYYAVRLTPHLEIERRAFAFEVPALPSADVRLLLRFGDEREEVGVELPVCLRIVRAPPAPAMPAPRALASPFGGEAARPGDPGVVAWVAGDRDGRGRGHRRAADPPGAAPAQLWPMSAALVGAPPPDPRPGAPPPNAAATAPAPTAARPRGALAAGSAPADPLLLTRRRNE